MCMTLLMSCDMSNKYGKCQVNYSVVYPDTTIVYDTVFTYNWVIEYDNIHIPIACSFKGSNYIRLGKNYFNSTTCPIRINSYKTISTNIDK